MEKRLILLLDFDGVIHSYTSDWKGADVVLDDPVPGAFAFIRCAMEEFDVCIYSARSRKEGGIQAMKDWIVAYGGADFVGRLGFPTQKPAAFLTIDDRCIQFDGTWPHVEVLKEFRPWNKRGGV